MRLCEFGTTFRKGTCGTELFAWAMYKRGHVPTQGEFAYIDGRVKAKFPNAELVYIKRRFVPVANSAEPTEVWWELKSAAREAYDRMTYMGGIDKLPPMVQDAYAILQEGIEHERKIRFNNEEGGAK